MFPISLLSFLRSFKFHLFVFVSWASLAHFRRAKHSANCAARLRFLLIVGRGVAPIRMGRAEERPMIHPARAAPISAAACRKDN